MAKISRMFQAFLAPTLVASARALLIAVNLCVAVGIVSRLRQYVHAKHAAAKSLVTPKPNPIPRRSILLRIEPN